VGPGAAEVDVEGVAVSFSGELGSRGAGDEGAELGGFTTELAVGVGVFVGWALKGGVSWVFKRRKVDALSRTSWWC